jgi:hypothetical protein
MIRRVALILVCLITALAGAPEPVSRTSPSPAKSTFGWIDVFIDSHDKPLAAYQLEIVVAEQAATVVGIEGGDAVAFMQPPYYDPAAMSQSRVIIAAFSTASELPKSKTRVARIHLQFSAPDRQYTAKLITAADPDGGKIAADATVSEGAQP